MADGAVLEGQQPPVQQKPSADPPTTPPPPDPTISRLEAGLAAQREEIERLKVASNHPPVSPSPLPSPPTKADLERRFFQDPLTSTAAIAQHAAANAVSQFGAPLETLRDIARDRVRSIDPEVFDKFEPEIIAAVGTMPPQFQANSAVWTNAFNIVRGKHITEVLEMKGQKAPPVKDGPSAPSVRVSQAPAKPPLSENEKIIAEGFGLTEDEYRHGKEFHENQDRIFGELLTTDSVKKRKKERLEKEKKNAGK